MDCAAAQDPALKAQPRLPAVTAAWSEFHVVFQLHSRAPQSQVVPAGKGWPWPGGRARAWAVCGRGGVPGQRPLIPEAELLTELTCEWRPRGVSRGLL